MAGTIAIISSWEQLINNLLLVLVGVIALSNLRRAKRVESAAERVEEKMHAANEIAKESHNALVDLADRRTRELQDKIDNATFKFLPEDD